MVTFRVFYLFCSHTFYGLLTLLALYLYGYKYICISKQMFMERSCIHHWTVYKTDKLIRTSLFVQCQKYRGVHLFLFYNVRIYCMVVNSKGKRVSKATTCLIIYISLEMWPSQMIDILIININFHITHHKSNVSFYMNTCRLQKHM